MEKNAIRRRRFTPAERTRLLTSYRRSGLTQREFALRNRLSLSCLVVWLRRSKLDRAGAVPATLMRIPGGLPLAGAASETCRIRFPSGLVLELPGGVGSDDVARFCQILCSL